MDEQSTGGDAPASDLASPITTSLDTTAAQEAARVHVQPNQQYEQGPAPATTPGGIHAPNSQVLVMHPLGPMRLVLRIALTQAGYTVTEAPNYIAVLRHLRNATRSTVVVCGNWAEDFRTEAEFFARITRDDATVRRHRFVLLTAFPEWLPPRLGATLRSLGVLIMRVPCDMPDMLATVAVAAGRARAEDESAG